MRPTKAVFAARFGTSEVGHSFTPLDHSLLGSSASLAVPTWNQIATFLESMRQLRNAVGFAA